jgi:hypothetical protein
MEGEVRSGGYGWNVVRYFALLWTFLFFVIGVASCANVGETVESAQTDAEQAGAGIGAGIGFMFIGVMWFFSSGWLISGRVFPKKGCEGGRTNWTPCYRRKRFLKDTCSGRISIF